MDSDVGTTANAEELVKELMKDLNYPSKEKIEEYRSKLWSDNGYQFPLWFILSVGELIERKFITPYISSIRGKVIDSLSEEDFIAMVNAYFPSILLIERGVDRIIHHLILKGIHRDNNIRSYYGSLMKEAISMRNKKQLSLIKSSLDIEPKTHTVHLNKWLEEEISYGVFFFKPRVKLPILPLKRNSEGVIKMAIFAIEEGAEPKVVLVHIINAYWACKKSPEVITKLLEKYDVDISELLNLVKPEAKSLLEKIIAQEV